MTAPGTEHLAESELVAYVLARASAAVRDRVEAHLETACPACLGAARRVTARLRDADRSVLGKGAGLGLERLEERVGREVRLLELELSAAPAMLGELLLLAPEARREAIRDQDRWALHGLAEDLAARARSQVFHDVPRALELAELAVEVAEAVSPGFYPSGLVADARAQAWGALANARRVRGELPEADRAIATARAWVGRGTQDRSIRADLLGLEGSLRIDQRRFDAGVQALDRALELAG